MEIKDNNKKIKKAIVNAITLSRVGGMFAIPLLFNVLSAPVFIAIVAAILLTDFVDGQLARRWDVSTIFGSIADMGADKLFGITILALLTTMYPIMSIPLTLEMLISKINTNLAEIGANTKSSQIGRTKMWFVGVSMCALLLVSMSPELITSISNIKTIDINNSVLSNLGQFGEKIVKCLNEFIKAFKENSLQFINYLKNNKEVIIPIAETASITSEALTAGDYAIKYIKNPDKNNKKYKTADFISKKQYRDYIYKVWLDEKYAKETKEMPLFEKLTPPELRKEENNVKKLTLDKK